MDDAASRYTLWVVTSQSMNSTSLGVKRIAAYFSEDNARKHAGRLVGSGTLIGLETIGVIDDPTCKHEFVGGVRLPEGGTSATCKKCGYIAKSERNI